MYRFHPTVPNKIADFFECFAGGRLFRECFRRNRVFLLLNNLNR